MMESNPFRNRAGYFQLSDLTSRTPPNLSVLEAPEGGETMRGRADILLALAETRDDPVKGFDVFIDDHQGRGSGQAPRWRYQHRCAPRPGNDRIGLVTRSKRDLLGEAMLEIKQNGEGMLDKRDGLAHCRGTRRCRRHAGRNKIQPTNCSE